MENNVMITNDKIFWKKIENGFQCGVVFKPPYKDFSLPEEEFNKRYRESALASIEGNLLNRAGGSPFRYIPLSLPSCLQGDERFAYLKRVGDYPYVRFIRQYDGVNDEDICRYDMAMELV